MLYPVFCALYWTVWVLPSSTCALVSTVNKHIRSAICLFYCLQPRVPSKCGLLSTMSTGQTSVPHYHQSKLGSWLARHDGFGDRPVFSRSPQVKAFPQESARPWPPEGGVLSSWERLSVLEALVSNTCSALKQFSPRALSLKAAAPPALIFAERAGKLIVLSVSPWCTYLCRSEASGKSPYSSVVLKMMQGSSRSRAIQMISSAPFTLRAGARHSQLHLPCQVFELASNFETHTVLHTLCEQLFTCFVDGGAGQDTLHRMAGRVCLGGSWARWYAKFLQPLPGLVLQKTLLSSVWVENM